MKKKKISRRKFLTILGVTGGVLVAGGVGGAAYIRSRFTPDTTPGPGEDGEIVTVAEGQLQGTINDGIYRYLGVPYAEAAERFVTAGPVTPWEGVLKADSYGPMVCARCWSGSTAAVSPPARRMIPATTAKRLQKMETSSW